MKTNLEQNGRQFEFSVGLTQIPIDATVRRATIPGRKFLLYSELYSKIKLKKSESQEETLKTEGNCGVDEARTRDLLRDRQAL